VNTGTNLLILLTNISKLMTIGVGQVILIMSFIFGSLEIPVDIDPCSGDIDPPLKWFGIG